MIMVHDGVQGGRHRCGGARRWPNVPGRSARPWLARLGFYCLVKGEVDGEGLQAIHEADGTPAEFPWGDRERHFREAGEQGAQGDLSLHAGQGSAQAVVDAVTEGDVAAGVAAEVEAVRVGELGGIPPPGCRAARRSP
jgi:hypothetical protein